MKLFAMLAVVLLSTVHAYAQEVSEEICQSYINTYCLRCHPAQRICDAIGVKSAFDWQETLKLMGEYGNLDKEIQKKVHACVNSKQSKDFNLCREKVSSAAMARAMTVSATVVAEESIRKEGEKIFRSIGPEEALRMLQSRDDITFLDVRTPKERSYGAIPGSKLVSIYALMKGEITFPKDKPILLVCAVGGRSYVAGQVLSKQGYREVYNLSGGVKGWYKAGLPLTYDEKPVETK